MNQNIEDIIELDNELKEFLNKYGSKLPYSLELKLNREWKKVGSDFQKRADEIFKRMSNTELLLSIGLTEYIFTIVNVIDYFDRLKMDFNKIAKGGPNSLIQAYIEILKIDAFIKKYSISDYYYEKIKEKNNISNIEKFLLSQMSDSQLIKLASISKEWKEKIESYGFI